MWSMDFSRTVKDQDRRPSQPANLWYEAPVSLSFPIGKTVSQGTSRSPRTTSKVCVIGPGLGMEAFWKGCMPTHNMGEIRRHFSEFLCPC